MRNCWQSGVAWTSFALFILGVGFAVPPAGQNKPPAAVSVPPAASAPRNLVRRAPGDGLKSLPGAVSGVYEGIVFTELPQQSMGALASGMRHPLWPRYGEGARLIRLLPDGSTRVLTGSFQSAADPDVSFDGKRILFAAKKQATDRWQIFEMDLDGSQVVQITHEPRDCRSPVYQPQIFYLDADAPVYQISFVGWENSPSASLYSSRMDGSGVRRLTFNPFNDADPVMMPDGRLLFAGWQRNRLAPGFPDRSALFGVNTDGTDYALLAGDEGARIKRMPAVTSKREVIFIESDKAEPDGSGSLAAVSLRRNLRSHRRLSQPSDGLFHSPSPLPNGEILVSWRPTSGGVYGIYRFDPAAGRMIRVHGNPDRPEIQAKALSPHPEPDGHSSVVEERDPTGKLYCLSVYNTDFPNRDWLAPGSVKRLRLIEGIPPHMQTRLLGEIAVEEDGSFNVQVPADTPIQMQALDAEGLALSTSSWIWVKNRESRGCIGCHEDRELTPDNVLARALTHPSVQLTLPPDRRRTVDFNRDIAPILSGRCGGAACHGGSVFPLFADGATAAKYVHAGRARTSPLVWAIFGRNTSRPWDQPRATGKAARVPPHGALALTDDERRAIIEWIDLGARVKGEQP